MDYLRKAMEVGDVDFVKDRKTLYKVVGAPD